MFVCNKFSMNSVSFPLKARKREFHAPADAPENINSLNHNVFIYELTPNK